ncbi:MAG: hypothetical protein ACT6Q9_06445 [Polaromonas sp.]|uniref:hypothetical protein n=1 Tax=Polaromonas sp. TaxID=1869339 RepID=UPI004036822C
MTIRKFQFSVYKGAAALIVMGLSACAATISQDGLEQRTSAAIGRQVGTFTIAKTGEETGGRINYTARTKDGVTYQCYMYSATGFQKAMSFGQTPHSDAICTAMGRGGPAPGADSKPAASCNALLKAAGRC